MKYVRKQELAMAAIPSQGIKTSGNTARQNTFEVKESVLSTILAAIAN